MPLEEYASKRRFERFPSVQRSFLHASPVLFQQRLEQLCIHAEVRVAQAFKRLLEIGQGTSRLPDFEPTRMPGQPDAYHLRRFFVAEFVRYSRRNQDATVESRGRCSRLIATRYRSGVVSATTIIQAAHRRSAHRLGFSCHVVSFRGCASKGAVISPSRRKSSSVYSHHTPRFLRNASSS